MISLKTPRETEKMRQSGRLVAEILAAVAAEARPGVKLKDLDAFAREMMRRANAVPSFLDYKPAWAPTPYPGVLCLSVNDVLVHGIPNGRKLQNGDLLSIDCGAAIDGFHADAAISISIGPSSAENERLLATAEQALAAGIQAAQPGARLGDVSHAIEQVSRAAGYGIPDGYGGHGIGRAMHEDPHVSNSGEPGKGLELRVGLVLALEPMLLAGGRDQTRVLADGWSVATRDGSRAVHVEHTIAITAEGPQILTAAPRECGTARRDPTA